LIHVKEKKLVFSTLIFRQGVCRRVASKGLEAKVKHRGATLEHELAQPPASTLAPGSTAADEWMLESGAPSDILHLTRGEVFGEVLRLRDDERQRIGQELHDSAGQLLLSLQLSVACLRGSEKNGALQSLVDEIHDTSRLIGQEIRSLAFLNHPIRMASSGLASALQSLIAGFGKRTGYHTKFKSSGDELPYKAESAMALLRVAQEALVNVHRHAHASSVTATLKAQPSGLELTIRDNGVGIPAGGELAIDGGVGVQGMRFRVEQLGGRFQIKRLKHGTKISASVPIAA
jgi:two-component system NarL family sensor kinase